MKKLLISTALILILVSIILFIIHEANISTPSIYQFEPQNYSSTILESNIIIPTTLLLIGLVLLFIVSLTLPKANKDDISNASPPNNPTSDRRTCNNITTHRHNTLKISKTIETLLRSLKQ